MPIAITTTGQRGRLHGNRQPLDHVGAVTRGGALAIDRTGRYSVEV